MQADLTMGNLVSALALQSDEAALIAELRAGSEEAFAWLIARYHQPIYSLLARMVQDRAEAADLTQEVFVKVFRGVGNFHGESTLRTWVYRIALHEASNQRRWWGRHKRQELTIDAPLDNDEGETFCLADALATRDASPYDCAARSEVRAHVEAALRTIPEIFREVVILREIEGFGYEEIAEILNVNLGTVKSRLTRGRAALRDALLKDAATHLAPRRAAASLKAVA